jgi:hypothetical protein
MKEKDMANINLSSMGAVHPLCLSFIITLQGRIIGLTYNLAFELARLIFVKCHRSVGCDSILDRITAGMR